MPVDKIVEAGLAIQPEDSREPYDRFRGRVMFPISDRRGRVIAFGGRVMGAGEPKYLNSPETPLFHKGANLYCLDRARVAATKDQPVIVAEGYMDVIALHGAGFIGAVAPLGTALTEGQLGELWKLADEPYLCFDGDNAGRRAAPRAAERALPLLRPGKSLRFLAPAGRRGSRQPDPRPGRRRHPPHPRAGPAAVGRGVGHGDRGQGRRHAGAPRQPASAPSSSGWPRSPIRSSATITGPTCEPAGPSAASRRARWRPGRRPFSAAAGPEPAPFAAGSAARRAGTDLDGSRQERALLGALIERPALLHILAEDLAALTITNPELGRLESGLLDVLSRPLGVDPAADEALAGQGGKTPLEAPR